MNLTAHLRILQRALLAAWLLGAASVANAVNYDNSDLLLVFRKDGFNDVEFDQGPVSGYLGLTQGTQKVVSYDVSLVKSNFNNSLAEVKFLLVGATGLGATDPRVWLTDAQAGQVPTQVTLSKFSVIRSKISAIGQQASTLTASNALPAVIAASQPGSFTYIASDANLTPASSLGGVTGFPVEAANPATLNFYEFQISTATPRPPATLSGSFTLDATGVLTFSAGSGPVVTAPTLTSIVRNGNAVTVSLSTVQGMHYQLRAAASVPGVFNSVGSPIVGNGTVQTLTDTSTDPVKFYQVETSL